MGYVMPRVLYCSLLIAILAPAAARGAMFRGRSIDGPRFSASVMNDDAGSINSVEVKFSGHNATVFLRGSSQLNLVLDEEDITDPRHIAAQDDRRGIRWEIEIRNLREA